MEQSRNSEIWKCIVFFWLVKNRGGRQEDRQREWVCVYVCVRERKRERESEHWLTERHADEQ